METRRLQKMLKTKHTEVEYLRSKFNMINDLATALTYKNS